MGWSADSPIWSEISGDRSSLLAMVWYLSRQYVHSPLALFISTPNSRPGTFTGCSLSSTDWRLACHVCKARRPSFRRCSPGTVRWKAPLSITRPFTVKSCSWQRMPGLSGNRMIARRLVATNPIVSRGVYKSGKKWLHVNRT